MDRDVPPLRLLTAFASVVRTGSVQAAAAELNVTQPAISQSVRKLEAHIGVALLDRGSRPARPTEAGYAVAAATTESLTRIADLLDTLRQSESRDSVAVTVACSVGVATYWLMPRLTAFYRAHPDCLVNVVTSQTGVPALVDGIDLAIRYGHGRWSDGLVRHLFDERVEPVCAPSLRVRFQGPVPPSAVSLLHVRSSEPSWVTWPDYLIGTGQPVVRGGGQSFTNYVQATQAALEGHGMMLGWRSITGALVETGELVPAGLSAFAPSDAFHLVLRRKRRGAATEAFAAWLTEAVRPRAAVAMDKVAE
ncbi:LysR substrate-binding domain-containing protein [Jannaschia seohaensis]|uniref:DNA-binding transcriptional LysR family regulator n=1 Tax=Jannaschia seohaensis TaxID=475081 RepID=A0A2Y9B4Z5_9RHOB|nr:LysR substrate-binding domain-containing protein [Jannaschia seohaensis]PWJ11180.1 DNA-binding transcriptional LysR family regulator [Jannaschia seohaensis]SSA51481.1 DNA-binding transcriptional regulator, LysR family [Jannaschia seohaensis]